MMLRRCLQIILIRRLFIFGCLCYFMVNLREVYETVRGLFNKREFLGEVKGRAGRLQEGGGEYRAVFVYSPENIGKARALEDFLAEKIEKYLLGVEYLAEPYSPKGIEERGFRRVLLVSKRGKPSEQEDALIRTLNFIRKDLADYR